MSQRRLASLVARVIVLVLACTRLAGAHEIGTTRVSVLVQDGRYDIERELGAGGMAAVFRAHDLRHDRDVAIKVLHPDLGATLGGERFLSEIRTTAKLQHPHILPLLDSGAAGDPLGPIDSAALEELRALEPGCIDVLVTHDGPQGVAVGYHGNTQGSRRLSALVAHLQPRFHVGGHYHHLNGPHRHGATVYLGLSCLVHPARQDPSRRIQPGAPNRWQIETLRHGAVARPKKMEVVVKDSKDATNRDAIRAHLPHISRLFGDGNFETPMFVHDSHAVPGTKVLAAKKSAIQYSYVETADGGRLDIVTHDAEALKAIHEYLKFQIAEHKTGDSLIVKSR